jgi:membrane-associated HD superfamily phosphohydrolase
MSFRKIKYFQCGCSSHRLSQNDIQPIFMPVCNKHMKRHEDLIREKNKIDDDLHKAYEEEKKIIEDIKKNYQKTYNKLKTMKKSIERQSTSVPIDLLVRSTRSCTQRINRKRKRNHDDDDRDIDRMVKRFKSKH